MGHSVVFITCSCLLAVLLRSPEPLRVFYLCFSTSHEQEFIIDLRKQSDRDKALLMEDNRKLTAEIEKVTPEYISFSCRMIC